MIKQFWFSNNEPCPCGSGKSFSNCCKKKESKYFHNNNELLHFTGQMLKKSKRRFCLFDGCNSRGKSIIRAHALQENRILNKLSHNGNVIMQDFSKKPVICEITKRHPEPFYFLSEVPISTATTATCFCETHDDQVFKKIEKPQYDLQTLDSEQCFLFAYKTFSFELYAQMSTDRFYMLMLSNVPQIARNPRVVIKYRNNKEKLADLEYYKDYFDKALKNNDFSSLETITLEVPYEVKFANYMVFSPPFDITGKNVHAYDRTSKRMKYVFFTVFPIEGKSYILISALKNDMKFFSKYFDEIRNASLNLVEYYINVFIPVYSQNLIIAPQLWNSWSEKAQGMVQLAVADPSCSNNLIYPIKTTLRSIARSRQPSCISTDCLDFNFFLYPNDSSETV